MKCIIYTAPFSYISQEVQYKACKEIAQDLNCNVVKTINDDKSRINLKEVLNDIANVDFIIMFSYSCMGEKTSHILKKINRINKNIVCLSGLDYLSSGHKFEKLGDIMSNDTKRFVLGVNITTFVLFAETLSLCNEIVEKYN